MKRQKLFLHLLLDIDERRLQYSHHHLPQGYVYSHGTQIRHYASAHTAHSPLPSQKGINILSVTAIKTKYKIVIQPLDIVDTFYY